MHVGIGAAAALALTFVPVGAGQSPLTPSAMRNHPAIQYQRTPPQDDVARLNERLRNREVTLEFEPTTGYLRSVLALLGVPDDSQLLVFSKASFQARRISPTNPRALFFNDRTSVGWVRGGEVLEFVSQDPRQGAIFYTLEQDPSVPPRFDRNLTTCVQCHTTDATANVPGMFVMSVIPSGDGSVLYAPTFGVDHRTSFENRWGGWYVTGQAPAPHMGNTTIDPGTELESILGDRHVASLESRFDTSGYPSRHSDVVALMVLEHQARLLNLMTRVGWESRIGQEAARFLDEEVQELVDYLLFVDEEPLPRPVTSTSTFARTFARQGPRDSKGQSLRELDLRTRLMRYRCSYLIYSESFDAIPEQAKRAIYARMWQILSGSAKEPRYARLSGEDRQAVIEILRETKADLPAYFGSIPSS